MRHKLRQMFAAQTVAVYRYYCRNADCDKGTFTLFSRDAQPHLRGKCPSQLAGYDISLLPMTRMVAEDGAFDWLANPVEDGLYSDADGEPVLFLIIKNIASFISPLYIPVYFGSAWFVLC